MSQKVIVHARDNSTGKPQITGASGGRYALGSVLVINCSDDDEWEISEGGLHEVNANGVPDELIPSSALPGEFQAGCMVGSLDGGQTFFSVGTCLRMRILGGTKVEGNQVDLTLYCWDSDYENNEGRITATVSSEVDCPSS
ncbi:MAG TPA: hypothetical protein DIU20_12805 [Cryomorphaceae bacterium]|nr:hypothetical protein [Owenweeksia sp.]HCQ17140.1 hypothetical protein [Cryomorphaceae bacterium]|tara:strand:+ start:3317 stop:3739 length:423 start_codon:yes stop_codon:yes gene_type:complete